MRSLIRQKLVDGVPEFGGRVFEPHAAGTKTQKPYAVVRQGVDLEDTPWTGHRTVVEVWPYVARTSFKEVDILAGKIKDVLDKQLLTDATTGDVFLCLSQGTIGHDFVDDEWDALTRGLRFQIYSLAWLKTVVMDPDPVEAFRKWTSQRFPELQTDPLSWSPTDSSPALYWRLAAIEGVEMLQWGSWITGRFQGHILAPSYSGRVKWIRQVTEGLALERQVDLGDGSRIFIQRLQADSEADPFRTGQIRVQAQFGVLKPAPIQTLINIATVSGAVEGSVT